MKRTSSLLPWLLVLPLGLARVAWAAPTAMLAQVSGQVEVRRGATKLVARPGLALQNGDRIVVKNGSAMVFSRGKAPQTLKSRTTPVILVVGGAAATAPASSLWQGVYDGVSRGLDRRDRRIAATMRPGAIETISPGQSLIETARPRFEWQPGALDAPRYQVSIRGAGGQIWSGQTETNWLEYPTSAPALSGALTWSVVPLRFENGGWKPIEGWSSEPVKFQIAAPSQIKTITAQLVALDEQLKSAAPAERTSSRAALLSSQGFAAWALRELGDPVAGEAAVLGRLREALWLETGQNWRMKAAMANGPEKVPQGGADPQILAYGPNSPLQIEARKAFRMPDGSFGIEIPAHWSCVGLNLGSGVTLAGFAALPDSLTQLSVTAGPLQKFARSGSLLKFVSDLLAKAPSYRASSPQTTLFRGAKVPKLSWTQTTKGKKQGGEMFEWRQGQRVYVLALIGHDAASLSALRPLWSRFQVPAAPKSEAKVPAVAEIAPAIDAALAEGDKVGKRSEDLLFGSPSEEATATEAQFKTLETQKARTAKDSHERTLAARNSAQMASRLGWAASQSGNDAEAALWFKRRAALQTESYNAEKAAGEAELRGDTAKLTLWQRCTPPQANGESYNTLLSELRDLMSTRLDLLRNLAGDRSDLAALERYNRQHFALRRIQLDMDRLDGGDITTLWDRQIRIANTLRYWGGLAEQRADFSGARAYYLCALNWRRSIPKSYAERAVEVAFLDLGSLETQTGDNLAARTFYEQGLAELDSAKDARKALIASQTSALWRERYEILIVQRYSILLNNLGVAWLNLGDFGASRKALTRALTTIETLSKTGYAGNVRAAARASTLGNQSSLASYEGDDKATLALLDQAMAENRSIQNDAGIALNFESSANILGIKGDFKAAQAKNEIARALFGQLQYSQKLIECTVTASTLSRLTGDNVGAELLAREALKMARSLGNPETIASSARAVIYRRLAILGAAAIPDDDAREFAVLIHEAEVGDAQSGIVLYQIETLGLRAEIEKRKGNLEGSLASLQAAIARIERLRATARSAEQFSDMPSIYSYYDDAVSLLLKLNRPDEAFDMLSRARSKKLNDVLQISALKTSDPALQNLIARAANLEQKLFKTRELLAAQVALPTPQRDTVKTDALRNLVATTQIQFFEVSDALKAKNPNFDQAVSLSPLELKKAQRVIPAGTLLLEYAILDDGLYIFAVTRNSLKIYQPRVSRADINGGVRAYRAAIDADIKRLEKGEIPSSIDDSAGDATSLRGATQQLSTWLLAPVQAEIDAAQTVAIVPSGALFYLPFHALGEADKDGKWRFLIEEKPVAYLAVGDVLAAVGTRDEEQMGKGILALGDPTGANLPAARGEVQSIARLFPASQSLVGADATKVALLRPSNLDKRVLHLAAHGVLDSARPEQSFIQLSSSPGDDGKLRVGEIRGIDLNRVDLVTLSSCRTAIGQGEPDGVEIASLAQSFSSAGTASVVASLWSVEDSSTALLMKSFYGALSDGLPKGLALQKAQKALISQAGSRHPIFWAPFELLGDWR